MQAKAMYTSINLNINNIIDNIIVKNPLISAVSLNFLIAARLEGKKTSEIFCVIQKVYGKEDTQYKL